MGVRDMLDRRHFLAGCLAGGGAALAALAVPDAARAALLHPDGLDTHRLIGDWYLDRYPAERDVSVLAKALSAAIPGFSRSGAQADPQRLKAAIRAARADDFARDDVVSIGGWLLARTECRLCALAALSRVG